MFEITAGCRPFVAESDLLWSIAIAGNMEEKAPSVLDRLAEDNRANFDNNLAKVALMRRLIHILNMVALSVVFCRSSPRRWRRKYLIGKTSNISGFVHAWMHFGKMGVQ